MKKNMLFLGLAQLFCGLLFCAAATFGNFPYNAFLWGLTGAGLGSGIVTLFSYWYNQNPERAQLYEKRLETHRHPASGRAPHHAARQGLLHHFVRCCWRKGCAW